MTNRASGFHRFNSKGGQICLSDVSLRELADTYGTPIYILDGEIVEEQAALLRRVFSAPPFRLLYSVKANPNLYILSFLHKRGFGLDACSYGDIQLGFMAGFTPSEISYTGVGLGHEEIACLANSGVWLNVDSISELERWVRLVPGRPVGLRLIPEVEAGFHPHCHAGIWGGKLGIPREQLREAIRIAARAGSPLRTLHAHIGSSILEPGPFLVSLEFLLEAAAEMSTVDRINLGGGLGVPFHPDDRPFPIEELRDGILVRLRDFERHCGRLLSVELEPGEFLVSEAGSLLVQVKVVKEYVREDRVVRIIIVDGSMNLYPAATIYGSYLHIYVNGCPFVDGGVPTDVYGNTNQAGDCLALRRLLPPLQEGDLLLIRNAGAYAYSRSTHFNERPRPAEVWVEDGTHFMVRRGEDVQVLLRGQEALESGPRR